MDPCLENRRTRKSPIIQANIEEGTTIHSDGWRLWGKFKRWPPSSGRYNLEEYIHLFQWIERKNLEGEDPFWSLVELVKADNSTDTWKKAIEGKEDTEGAEKVEDNEVCAEKQAQEDAEVDTDEEEY